ncbi:MAG: response regulator transcription factor [Vulcanimicrobiaceae bacterium]
MQHLTQRDFRAALETVAELCSGRDRNYYQTLVIERLGALIAGGAAVNAGGSAKPHLHLTPREFDVLASAAHGRTNAEIAFALRRSPRTVQKHLESVFRKLDVRTRTAAAAAFFAAREPAMAALKLRER